MVGQPALRATQATPERHLSGDQSAPAQQEIDRIDQAIYAVRRELLNRLHFNPDCSARQWGAAWDRCPDLRARESDLYRQRGDAQVLRDKEINRAYQAEQRRTSFAAKKKAKIELLAARAARCEVCGAQKRAA